MPRGRPAEVRYFFDDKAGRLIAVGSDGMRVLEEISGRRRGPGRRGPGRPRKAATEGGAGAPTTGKRRGRPRKAKSEEKKES